MNLHIINVIIGREYITRVKKKSFILTTFLVPILFAAMCILPSVIMMAGKDKTQKVAVVDRSGIVMPVLADDELAQYSDYSSFEADSVKNNLESLGMDILLVVSPIDSSNAVSVASYSKKPLGVDLSASISGRVDEAVEQYRIASYNIDNLEQIMASVKSDVHILTYTLDDSGNEKISSSEIYMLVSMVLGMIIYMFIAIFCGMVMSSVIEEKASRVVEVLVSSVKATELMFGKIIGVALVALTQFFMWVIVTAVLVGCSNCCRGPFNGSRNDCGDDGCNAYRVNHGHAFRLELRSDNRMLCHLLRVRIPSLRIPVCRHRFCSRERG